MRRLRVGGRAHRRRHRPALPHVRTSGAARTSCAREAAEGVREPRPGAGPRAGAGGAGARGLMADPRTAMLRLSALVGERTLFENEGYRRLWLARLLSATPVNSIVYTMLILVVNATGKSFFSSLFV